MSGCARRLVHSNTAFATSGHLVLRGVTYGVTCRHGFIFGVVCEMLDVYISAALIAGKPCVFSVAIWSRFPRHERQ